MITLFIFYIHTVAAVTAFTRRWQEGGWGEGFLAIGFIVLVFSVGWSISAFLLGFVMEKKGFGVWLDRDAFSLVLLTLMEGAFYYVQMKRSRKNAVA